jgi:hypothetical protein
MTIRHLLPESRTTHAGPCTVLPHRLLLVALICCLATFASACGGGGNSSTPSPVEPAPPPHVPAPAPPPVPPAPVPPKQGPEPSSKIRCPAGWPIELGYQVQSAGMYQEIPYCGRDATGVDTVVVNRSPLVWSFDQSTYLPYAALAPSSTATFFRSQIEASFSGRQYMLPGDVFRVPSHRVSWRPDYTLTAEWVGLSEAFQQIAEFGEKAHSEAIAGTGPAGLAAIECGKSAASALDSVSQITDESLYLDRIKTGVQTSAAGAKCARMLTELEKAEDQRTGKVTAAVSAWDVRVSKWTSANEFMDDVLKGLKFVIKYSH